jgi:hypothetical protein
MSPTTKMIEMPSSSSAEMAMPGEEVTWTQAFRFFTTDINPTVWDVLGDALVPKQGQRYAGVLADYRSNFVCRSVSATPVPQAPQSQAWDIRVKWTCRAPQDPTRPYFKISRSTTTRTAQFWRTGSMWTNAIADGTEPMPPVQDLGGVKTDTNGQPITMPVFQQQIQVDVLWDRTKDNSSALGYAASPDPPMNWYDDFGYSRNSAAFLGWPIGYVIYQGWSFNPGPDEMGILSHRFLADNFQFCEQRPLPNTSGKPLLDTGLTWGGTAGTPAIPVQAQKYVFWYQPYRTLTNFSTLFTIRPNLWEAMTAPKPVWPTT